ncbi:ATP-binding protein [Paenibacillus sp. LHD-117]|uniref:sensor histidine kinase n=1 Tax=Paenibacillus sp. LHD-117 TaxID=3071412 RepID=UPI0027DF7AE4|nr:ATP-binding protein [Paenibacillus sp. LHD-117]MDQ6419856.1 ATP-binding protein [Paenibacillus sp. LHD-117]
MRRDSDRQPGRGMFGVFMRDRLLYILCVLVIVGLAVCLLLLERKRYPGMVETGTVYYFILLSFVALFAWLAADYIRQRYYFKQMYEAIERTDDLQASTIVQSAATEEQRLVIELLQEQHRAFLGELNRYRRSQEMHNHFVLQWVHHMKTPISVIHLQMQEGAESGWKTEEEQRSMAASMIEEADRLTRGLEMMLHTARLDKFELDVHIRRLPLHDLIRTAINAHKRLCIRHSIFPKVEGELWVESDEKWMTFVLNQLVSNAIKYSKNKPGAKALLFRLLQQEAGRGELIVSDEGIGIAPQDIPRVFDPFFTGENGRTTGESTGMGLYLAKRVMTKLGHGIRVESELGSGTTVTLTFEPKGIHVIELDR